VSKFCAACQDFIPILIISKSPPRQSQPPGGSKITRSYGNKTTSLVGIAALAESTAVELFAERLLALATGVVNSSLEKRTLV
jgi:hypothetical protein